jgi:hypothetical protein
MNKREVRVETMAWERLEQRQTLGDLGKYSVIFGEFES